MRSKALVLLYPLLLLLVMSGSAGCRPAERPEVMSSINFHLLSDVTQPVVRESYRVKYHNHNTRLTTTRNSISTSHFTDELYRGLYNVQVEGTLLLKTGETVWLRGSVTERLFLEPEEECEIHLQRMP